MDFSKALEAMKEDKKVKRRELSGFFKIDDEKHSIIRVGGDGFYFISMYDKLADDWEVTEDKHRG